MYDYNRLMAAGISDDDARQLRRISMTLHRWHEMECGDGNQQASWAIARGKKENGDFTYDDDGKPFMEIHWNSGRATTYRAIPDRERGALKRLAAIMADYPSLSAFVQTDPRGCALYIGKGLTDSNYSGQGIAVYK